MKYRRKILSNSLVAVGPSMRLTPGRLHNKIGHLECLIANRFRHQSVVHRNFHSFDVNHRLAEELFKERVSSIRGLVNEGQFHRDDGSPRRKFLPALANDGRHYLV